MLFNDVILAVSTTSKKCRQDAQQSARAGIKLESKYEGVTMVVNTNVFIYFLVLAAGDCPERDQSCVAADGSNVITTTTTSDDAECGRKLSILVHYVWGFKITFVFRLVP